MLIFGIALAVAVVPEALPAVVTISLAIGVRRMVKRNALMRRLPAVETLGSTSVICSDKTGTLTKDEMTARRILCGGKSLAISGAGYEPRGDFSSNGSPIEAPEFAKRLLRAAVLASDAHIIYNESEKRWHVKGDPTEGALVVAAAKAGLKKSDLEGQYPRLHEIPFTSETKRMTTLHGGPEGEFACSKGAPEILLETCSRHLTPEGEKPLDETSREAIREAAQQMASEALRVLGIAEKRGASLADAEKDMTFLGLVGMIDPPRPEAKPAIETCRLAGIRAVMITGDHPLTARAVATELGMLRGGKVVTGAELNAIPDEEFEREVETVEVYARVSPAHKLKVVTALQKRGHVVAMTGDGVNDAPALKKADIGIAMGITGTDVTKEAAAMTLTDDNFASIVAAVEEGRAIFGNIKKYLMYLLSSNIGEICLMAGATLLGLPLPLSAVQILYVNLATDGLPALALAVDPRGARPHAEAAASPDEGNLHPPGRRIDGRRRTLVGAREPRDLHVGPPLRPEPRRGDDHHLRFAGADSVLQGLQLPLRPPLRAAKPVRQQVAERGHRLGAPPPRTHSVRPRSREAFRQLQPVRRRLGGDPGRVLDHFPGAGAHEMARAPRALRKAGLKNDFQRKDTKVRPGRQG